MIDRRTFLTTSLAAGGLAALACAGASSVGAGKTAAKPTPKRILILGGTGFLGPHIVDAALARGHTLTLFNRGKTHPDFFPNVEKLHGDRDGHMESLAGRKWDAVIDTSGYVPRVCRMSAELLAPSVAHYLFISTISVYGDVSKPGMDESGPLAVTPDPKSEDVGKYYGALKALCESTIGEVLPGHTTVVRPGLIVGPAARSRSDRYTYWPVRIDRGGEVLAPGDGKDPVQYIDSRDLAAFCVTCVEAGSFGTYNATGPATTLTMGQLLDACQHASGNKAQLTWVDSAFLDKKEVAPWSELPVWTGDDPDEKGFARLDCKKAIAHGLTFRNPDDTARDTLAVVEDPAARAAGEAARRPRRRQGDRPPRRMAPTTPQAVNGEGRAITRPARRPGHSQAEPRKGVSGPPRESVVGSSTSLSRGDK